MRKEKFNMAQKMGTSGMSGVVVVSVLSGSSRAKEIVALNIAPEEPTSHIETHCGQLVGLHSRRQSH